MKSSLARTAEVVVIGGGIIGLSIAYHLSSYGVRALVLERDRLGSGSTARSSGGIRRLFETEPAIRLAVESVRFWERFEERVGRDLDWHRVGYLLLSTSAASTARWDVACSLLERWDVPVRRLAPEHVAAMVPIMWTEDIHAAYYCSGDGYADPYGALQGFRNGARRQGAQLIEKCTVTGIRVAGETVQGVVTTEGEVSTHVVVNAAGPWARLVGQFMGIDVPVLPRRQHQWIIEAPVPQPGLPCTLDLDSTLYVRPEGSRFLVGIGSDEPCGSYDASTRIDAFLPAAEKAMQRFPSFDQARLVRAWAGLLEETPDHLPLLGPCGPKGAFIAAGFSGHGFMQAPAAGQVIADLVVAGRTKAFSLEPYLPSRFKRAETDDTSAT
jgi:sarcosine oxidase subunit beta